MARTVKGRGLPAASSGFGRSQIPQRPRPRDPAHAHAEEEHPGDPASPSRRPSLAGALVEPELPFGGLCATAKHDPKWEAVLVLEQEECLDVSIVGHRRSWLAESMSRAPVN